MIWSDPSRDENGPPCLSDTTECRQELGCTQNWQYSDSEYRKLAFFSRESRCRRHHDKHIQRLLTT